MRDRRAWTSNGTTARGFEDDADGIVEARFEGRGNLFADGFAFLGPDTRLTIRLMDQHRVIGRGRPRF